MKQQKIMWLGMVVVLSCCFISSLAYAVAESPQRRFVSLKGTGQVRQEHVQQWHPAAVNQGVFAGNYVRTGDLSRMALLFSDQTQLSLNQNSQLQIKQVRDQIKNLNTAVRLNQGRSWTQSRQASQQMIMETPSAIAAIRGTDWDMEVDERGKSTITVLSGEVEFYNDQGKVTVRKNEQASAEVGKAPVKIIITNPRNRVQWVSQYTVETLRHIYLRGAAVEESRQDLQKTKGDDPARGGILADLGQWEKAEQAFRTALEKRPDEPGRPAGHGVCGTASGRHRESRCLFLTGTGESRRGVAGPGPGRVHDPGGELQGRPEHAAETHCLAGPETACRLSALSPTS